MIHAVLVRFSEDPDIYIDGPGSPRGGPLGEGGVEVGRLTCVRKAAWGTLCTDDAGIVS